nr:MAG TPA: hypothetical protein [Caudoviricetes sp.]
MRHINYKLNYLRQGHKSMNLSDLQKKIRTVKI